jgi:hypothetical protein
LSFGLSSCLGLAGVCLASFLIFAFEDVDDVPGALEDRIVNAHGTHAKIILADDCPVSGEEPRNRTRGLAKREDYARIGS